MNENQSTENFDPTLNKILKFKESLKSPDAKNNTFLSIDSAVWYIEALLNYNYCVIKDSSEIYPNTKMDSTFTEININNNKIAFSDVARTYFQIEKTILTGLDNLNSENKRVNIVDVEYKDGDLLAYFIFYYEDKNNKSGLYQIVGDWHWGPIWNGTQLIPGGMCDWTYYGERDLTTEIKNWIRANRPPLMDVYWTDITHTPNTRAYYCSIPGSGYTTDDYDVSQIGGSFFTYIGWFNDPYPDYIHCVSQAACNYWAQQSNQTITLLNQNGLMELNTNVPNYEDFRYINIYEIRGMWWSANYYAHTILFHRFRFIYGIPHKNIIPN